MAIDVESEVILSPDHKFLQKWLGVFAQDYEHHKEWMKDKRKASRYYDGEQLDEEVKNELAERGQPAVVFNRIKPAVDTLVGIYLGSNVMQKAYDRGSRDFDTAKFVTEALRYVEQNNQFDEKEERVAEDAIIDGKGYYKLSLDFDEEEIEFKIENIDNEDVIVDRYCKKADLTDAKHIFETAWVDMEDLIEEFPEFEKEIRAAVLKQATFTDMFSKVFTDKIGDQYQGSTEHVNKLADIFVDTERKRIRVIHTYYRKTEVREIAVHQDFEGGAIDITGDAATKQSMEQNLDNVQFVRKRRKTLNSAILIANAVLEKKEDIRPHDKEGKFFHVEARAYLTRGEIKKAYGLVKQYIPSQDEINKRRSKLLHLLNVRQIALEGAAADDIEELRAEAARPDGVMLFRPGSKWELLRDSEAANGQIQLLGEAKSEIMQAGVNGELAGLETNATSGKAIQLRQNQGALPLRKIFANMRAARRRVFRLLLEEMQQYWTSEKLIKITDDPQAGEVILNQRVTDPETGKTVILNDLSLGKYDIIVDESEDTLNLRSEQFASLVKLMEPLAAHGFPVPVDMLIKVSDLPQKRELMGRFQQAQQEQIAAQAAAQAAGMGAAPQAVQ